MCLINTEVNPPLPQPAEPLQSVAGCLSLVSPCTLTACGWMAVDVPHLCPKPPAASTPRQPRSPQKSLLFPLTLVQLGCSALPFAEEGGEGGGRVASSATFLYSIPQMG